MGSESELFIHVLAGVPPLEPIVLPLLDALSCTLAEEIRAPGDIPAYDTALHAGCALRAGDLSADEPWEVVDEVPAGFRATAELVHGTCIKVARGAPLPPGADTVVQMQHVTQIDGAVLTTAQVPGAGIARAGSVQARGDLLASAGAVVDADLIGVLARSGVRALEAYPRPRVCVVTVGSEYVEPGVPTPVGLAADHLSFLAAGIGTEAGAVCVRLPPVLDEPAEALAVLEDNAGRADVIVLCGLDLSEDAGFSAALGLDTVQGDDFLVHFGVLEGVVTVAFPDDPADLSHVAGRVLPALIGQLMGRRA